MTYRRLLLAGLIGVGAHGGYHGLFTWLPTLLRRDAGYSHWSVGAVLFLITAGFALGCVVAGLRSARMMGRRTFLAGIAAASLPATPHGAPCVATDTHAHVFTRSLPLATQQCYSVDYDATPERYLWMLHANRMGRGVLIQPSSLGFDKSFLLGALARAPERLRGIVALAKSTSPTEIDQLADRGVTGVRLNLLGRANPDLSAPAWRQHLAAIRERGWQVEVECEAARLPRLLPALLNADLPIVVDHFGRPDGAAGVSDRGFRYLLSRAASGRVYVKLSGAYLAL